MEREWKQRNFIHDFPRVPEVKHFGQCALVRTRARATTGPPAWYLADKVAQSCVHYEIRGPEEYDEWKKGSARQGGRLYTYLRTAREKERKREKEKEKKKEKEKERDSTVTLHIFSRWRSSLLSFMVMFMKT